MAWAGGNLSPGRHALTIVPGTSGYEFISASGILADFTFMVKADGTIVVDPRFAGFAQASGQTLTIKGYRITLDTQALSHAVLPLLLDWAGGNLSPGRHDLTIVPGTSGYEFISASGIVADITRMVKADGAIVVDPRFAGFAQASGQTLSSKEARISLVTLFLS